MRAVIIGPSAIDLSSEQYFADLKNTFSFKKSIGGIGATLAIGCARLGLTTTLVSERGNDKFGDFLIERLQQENIHTAPIKENPGRSTSLLLRAQQSTHLQQSISYQETHESALTVEDIQDDLIKACDTVIIFASNFFIHEFWILSVHAIQLAKQQKKQVYLILDIPNKSSLSANSKKEQLEMIGKSIIHHCDLIIGTDKNWQELGAQHQLQASLTHLRTLSKAEFVVIKDNACAIFTDGIGATWEGQLVHSTFKGKLNPQASYEEGFCAGYIAAKAQKETPEEILALAFACQMITHNRPNTSDHLPSIAEVNLYLSSQHQITANPLQSTYFLHTHFATTQQRAQNPLCLFNFGYQQLWVKGLLPICKTETAALKAKQLVAQGIAKVCEFDPSGMILDETDNSAILEIFPRQHGTIVRPVEVPMSIPIQFNTDIDITSLLNTWPQQHIAKATIIYHPDDRFMLREAQEDRLQLLYRACRAQNRSLIVDIVPPAKSLITASTFTHILKHFYEIGIYADWWQIPHQMNARSYEHIQQIIHDNDPYCRGFLLNLSMASTSQLKLMLEAVAGFESCGGFTLGRHTIQAALDSYFKQKMSDDALIESVAHQFRKTIKLWEEVHVIQDNAQDKTA